jgi:hypothetical protein
MLLRHSPDAAATLRGKTTRTDGTLVRETPSAIEYAEREGAPRSLLLKLRAMAKQQQAEAEKAKVIAANSAVPSNTFEDPTRKVLTEAEEKKKARKREQKKKAKAKKKAAAKEAHAGAGKEGAEVISSDSDSSGPDDEEEGMDEEERMLARAPTFDLEKERAARKAEAIKKAKKRERKDRAKAERRAAAEAAGYAMAGKDESGTSSTDSDSSGPDEEEEGMDEEERMIARAPTFDLEKERAARKARAEAEKGRETKE